MVWYDDIGNKVRIPDVAKALDRLNGEGTIDQIKEEILLMYELPKGMIRYEREIKEPLEDLIEMGIVERSGAVYKIKEKYMLKKEYGDNTKRIKMKEEKKLDQLEEFIKNLKPEDIVIDHKKFRKSMRKAVKEIAKAKYGLDSKFLNDDVVVVKMKIPYDILADITLKEVSIKIGDDVYPLEKLACYQKGKEE